MGRRSDHTREELYGLALDAAELIVEKDGHLSLTVRRVAGEIGYSHGTLYNVFDDLDDIIVHLNGRTLDALWQDLEDIPLEDETAVALMRLCDGYIEFTKRHRNRWALLFEHRLPEGRELPEWHYEKIYKLLGLIETALSPLFPQGRERERVHSARVLWSSVHGICSLQDSQKLAKHESAEALTRSLIAFYVEGLRSAASYGRYK